MKYQFVSCRTSLLSEIAKFAAVFFFPIVAIALLGGAVFLLVCGKQANDYSYTLLMGYALVAAVAGAYLMRLSLICYALESRKIAFNQFGFTTKIRKNHAYPGMKSAKSVLSLSLQMREGNGIKARFAYLSSHSLHLN